MKEDFIKDIDAERLEVLRRLPKSIVEKLSKEEIKFAQLIKPMCLM